MSKEPHKQAEKSHNTKVDKKSDSTSHTSPEDAEINQNTEGIAEHEINFALECQSLKNEIEDLHKKSAEYFEGWQRERADFTNYKKRIERDQASTIQNITGEVVKKYLVILDDLERALKTRPCEGESAKWADGIDLITRKLQNILENENVKRILAENEIFDPSRHEAVTHEDSPEHSSGQVIEVIQQGYTIGDRVLRPALVRVAR